MLRMHLDGVFNEENVFLADLNSLQQNTLFGY